MFVCVYARIVVFVGLSQQKRCVKYSVKLIDVKINMLLFSVWVLCWKNMERIFALCLFDNFWLKIRPY